MSCFVKCRLEEYWHRMSLWDNARNKVKPRCRKCSLNISTDFFQGWGYSYRQAIQNHKAVMKKQIFSYPERPTSFKSCATSPGRTPELPPASSQVHRRLSCQYLGLCFLSQRICGSLSFIGPGWVCLSFPFHWIDGEWSHHTPFLRLGHSHIHLACPHVSHWSLLKRHLLWEAFLDHLRLLNLPYFAPQRYYILLCLAVYCLSHLGGSELHGSRDMPPTQLYI